MSRPYDRKLVLDPRFWCNRHNKEEKAVTKTYDRVQVLSSLTVLGCLRQPTYNRPIFSPSSSSLYTPSPPTPTRTPTPTGTLYMKEALDRELTKHGQEHLQKSGGGGSTAVTGVLEDVES